MPREKKTISCAHCGKEFTQARKDQKYCSAECRFNHFFEKRDSEKARSDEQIAALQKENEELKAHIRELMAELQTATIPALATTPKRSSKKVAAS